MSQPDEQLGTCLRRHKPFGEVMSRNNPEPHPEMNSCVNWLPLPSPGTEEPDWHHLALHALHDLRIAGVPIEKIIGITPEVLDQVETYSREMESFS